MAKLSTAKPTLCMLSVYKLLRLYRVAQKSENTHRFVYS